MRPDQRELLRRLTLNDEAVLGRVVAGSLKVGGTTLEERTASLVRLAAVLTVGAEEATLHAAVERGRAAGASDPEILESILAVRTIVEPGRLADAISSILPVVDHE